MGPVDHEAIRAAAGANRRGSPDGGSRRSRGRDSGYAHEQRDIVEPDEASDDDEEWTSTKRSGKSKATARRRAAEKDTCRSQKLSRRNQREGQFTTEDFWAGTAD
eukprot:scaffold34530_cov96-Phaeocystis_antarctica.AAC.1